MNINETHGKNDMAIFNEEAALETADDYMSNGAEPTSALRQAANDHGLEWGTDAMSDFVTTQLAKI